MTNFRRTWSVKTVKKNKPVAGECWFGFWQNIGVAEYSQNLRPKVKMFETSEEMFVSNTKDRIKAFRGRSKD